MLTASLLLVGVAPLLGAPAAHAGIESVSPTAGHNADGAARLVITHDEEPGDPLFSLADAVELRRVGLPADTVTCGDPVSSSPVPGGEANGSSPTQLVVYCDLRGVAPGTYDVAVVHPLPDTETVEAGAFTIFGGTPSVSVVNPSQGGRNSSRAVTITGTNLSEGTVVEFFKDGVKDSGIALVSPVYSASMTTITGTLNVSNAAQLGAHSVRVTTTDTGSSEKANAFTVNPAPVVAGFRPNGVGQNATTGRSVEVTGTDFVSGMTAALTNSTTADGVTVGAVTFVSPTKVQVMVTTTDTAGTGVRNLTFTNPDGGRATVDLPINPKPTITTVSPAARGAGSLTQNITVTGTNFVNTAGEQTVFTIDNPGNITINSTTIDSPTQATLQITVPANADPGARTMTVTNFDGGKSTKTSAFTINSAPQITGISPASKARGAIGQALTISGSGFSNAGGTPNFDFGPGVTVTNRTFVSANQVNIVVDLANDAAQGPRNVKAVNPDGGTSTCTGCFSVDGLGVTGVTPTGSLNGGPRTITLSGSGFSTDGGAPTVTLVPDGAPAYQPSITATDAVVSNGGSTITATVDLGVAAPGSYKPRVTNANGDTGLCTCTFTVASATPTVTSVTPNTRVQGAQDQTLVVAGTGFSNGSIVTFSQAGITVQSTTIDSPTQITLVVDVSPSASTALGNVTVTLANGSQNGTCTGCFKVNPAPTVTGVNPVSRAKGSTGSVVITGTNFLSGATVSFTNPKVTVTGTPTITATQITATVVIASDATTGPTSVTVTNPDTGTATCTNCFTVNGPPTATGVAPNKGGVGKSVEVLITGTAFAPGPATVTAGPGIFVPSANRVSETSVNATFIIDSAAAQGLRDVTVTLGDGGQATCEDCFTVISSPTVTGVAPNSRAQGTTGPVTITGTGFETDGGNPTLVFSGAGLTVSDVQVVSPTSITATLAIAPTAATGTRSLTVTNVDGGSGVCATCLNVTAGPTVTSVSPSSAARGRTGVDVTITGEGFAANAEPVFGTGITITPATTPVVTVNPSAADTIAAKIDIAHDAPLGGRQIGVRNPTDGATGVCASACFSVLAGRILVVEVYDTKGTTATTDDVLTTKPVSGAAYRVVVTAKTTEDPAGPTDTAFTGPITLTAPQDGVFVPGACADAVGGVASCTDVKFGDLGPALLTARATAPADADRTGTLAVVTQPTGLEFAATPATTATTGQPVTFSFRPTVGLTGADRAGYATTRRVELTGTGANLTDGAPVTCAAETCQVSLTWSSSGAKSVQFVDESTPPRATPTIFVNVVEVGLYKPLSPARILDTRRTNDGEQFSSPLSPNGSITLQVGGRGGVPTTATAVVANVTVTQPTGTSYLTLWPAGEARPTASTLNFIKGQTVANLAVLKLGTDGKVNIYNQANSTHAVMDVVGYYTDDDEGDGGRLVGVQPARVFDTAFGSAIGQNSSVAATVVNTGGVPSDAAAVVLSVTAVRPTNTGYLTVYPDGEARPLASTVNFPGGRTVANLVYAKVGSNGKVRVYNVLGTTNVTLDVLGYVTKTGNDALGRFVGLAPRRVLDTRGTNGGLPGRVNAGQTITPKVTGVAGSGVPATGVSAVVVNVTVTGTTGTSHLTLYPTGASRPGTSNVQWVAGQTTANLAVVKVGPDGRIAVWNRSGATHVVLDVVGYLTS